MLSVSQRLGGQDIDKVACVNQSPDIDIILCVRVLVSGKLTNYGFATLATKFSLVRLICV